MDKLLFKLGQIVMTRGVADWHAEDLLREKELFCCIGKHSRGDWGDVCAEDAAANDQALIDGDRLLSAYTVDDKKIWIITEADRSVTTLLFPEEY